MKKGKEFFKSILSDLNPKISEYCKKCTDVCCKPDLLHIVFSRDEIQPFINSDMDVYNLDQIDSKSGRLYISSKSDYIKDSNGDIIKEQSLIQISSNRYLLYSGDDIFCHFCDDKTHKCQIWEKRPLVCRIYPFNFEYNEDKKSWIKVMDGCMFSEDIRKDLKEYIKSIDKDLVVRDD